MVKRIGVLVLLCAMLTGCGAKTNAGSSEVFTLSKQQQEKYTGLIENTLNSFYWHYDNSTLAYYEAAVPDKSDQNSQMYEASKADGFDMEKYSGKDAVVYTATLTHFNSEKAGIVYFYFVKDNIAALFYTPQADGNLRCSLNERNIFVEGTKFKAYETDNGNGDFTGKKTSVLTNGFCSNAQYEGKMCAVALNGNYISVYQFGKSGFSRLFGINMGTYGFLPIEAAILNDGSLAVLAGTSITPVATDENADEAAPERIASKKIMFFDMKSGKAEGEIALQSDTYSCICSVSKGIMTANDKDFELYEKKDGSWTKTSGFYEGIQATDMKETDIDFDGTKELVATDGKDMFVFEQTSGNPKCVWRTNISADSFSGYIYPADLNGDGVKEIYICDSTGTAIRYVLKPKGLFSKNDDISYGQKIFAADFNGDGKDDYILSDGENTVLNIRQ